MLTLLSLNLWGGKTYEPLLAFIKEHASTTDIFCFQEVFSSPVSRVLPSGCRSDLYEILTATLPHFQGSYSSEQDGFDLHEPVTDIALSVGQAIFVKKPIAVDAYGVFPLYREPNGIVNGDVRTMPKIADYVRITNENSHYTIVNVQGLWYPWDKLDTEERIAQSAKILDFLSHEEGKKIVCGDFNVRPETRTIAIVEEKMKNLIKAQGIMNTRGSLYPYQATDPMADYMFVSSDIEVAAFSVLDVAVSDHLPLILEFS